MADDLAERTRLYERAKDELVAGQRSNAEQFDRSVLTLSAGFLALSVSFVKDVVPFAEMVHAWLLYSSWILFAIAISLTLFGMLYGQHILKSLIAGADQYYLQAKPEAWHLSESLPRQIDRVNVAVGVMFAAGVFFTVAFVIVNIGGRDMWEKPKTVPPRVERGQPANTFPKVPASPQQPATSDPPKPTDGSPPPQQAPASK